MSLLADRTVASSSNDDHPSLLVTSVPTSLSNVRKHLGDVNKRLELLHHLGEKHHLDMSVEECHDLAMAHTNSFLDILGMTTRNTDEVGDTSTWGPEEVANYAGSIHAAAAVLKESKAVFDHHLALEDRLTEQKQTNESSHHVDSEGKVTSPEVDDAITLYDRFLNYTLAASHLYATDKSTLAVERMYENLSRRAPDTEGGSPHPQSRSNGRRKKNNQKTQKDDITWDTAMSELKFARDTLRDTTAGIDPDLWQTACQRRDLLRNHLKIDTDDEFYERHFGSMKDDYSGMRWNMSTLGDIQKYLSNRSEVLEKEHEAALVATANRCGLSKIAILDPARANPQITKDAIVRSGFGLDKASLLIKDTTREDAVGYFEKARQGVRYTPDSSGTSTVRTVVRNISKLRDDAQDEYHKWVKARMNVQDTVTSQISLSELENKLNSSILKMRRERSTMRQAVEQRREFDQMSKIAKEYDDRSTAALRSIVDQLKSQWDSAATADAERRTSLLSQADLIESELQTSWTAKDYHTFKAIVAEKLRPSDFSFKNAKKAYNRIQHADKETAQLYGERLTNLQEKLYLLETGGAGQNLQSQRDGASLEMERSFDELTLSATAPANAFEHEGTSLTGGNNQSSARGVGKAPDSRRWADMMDEEETDELDDLMEMPWSKRDMQQTDTSSTAPSGSKRYATWADLFK